MMGFTVLITGVCQGSIGIEILIGLLSGGTHVVVVDHTLALGARGKGASSKTQQTCRIRVCIVQYIVLKYT